MLDDRTLIAMPLALAALVVIAALVWLAGKWLPALREHMGPIMLGATVVVGLVAYSLASRWITKYANGTTEGAAFFDRDGSSTLFILDSLRHQNDASSGSKVGHTVERRIKLIDATTGHQLALLPLKDVVQWIGRAGDSGVWFTSGGAHPQLRDARSGAVIASESSLRLPAPVSWVGYDDVRRALRLTTNDGTIVVIDPNTYAATKVAPDPMTSLEPVDPVTPGRGVVPLVPRDATPNPTFTLVDEVSAAPVHDGDASFTARAENLDKGATLVVSRVAAGGGVEWHTKITATRDGLRAVHRVGDTLVLVSAGNVLALRTRDGSVAWSSAP